MFPLSQRFFVPFILVRIGMTFFTLRTTGKDWQTNEFIDIYTQKLLKCNCGIMEKHVKSTNGKMENIHI